MRMRTGRKQGKGVEVKGEDVGAPEFEFRPWVWVAHLTIKPSFSDDSSSVDAGAITRSNTKRMEGEDNLSVTLHNECEVVVGGSLDPDVKSDTDENEFWNYSASTTTVSIE